MIDEEIKGQTSLFDQDIWSGKMSQEPSPPTKEKTSNASSKKQPKSSRRTPLYLNLQKADGHIPDASWETDGALLTDYSMRNTGVSPNEDVESLLSQILQAAVHPRYYLTAKASRGILLRASARGRELPTVLKLALERQAGESLS